VYETSPKRYWSPRSMESIELVRRAVDEGQDLASVTVRGD
jgi:hypothetical protein